MTTTTMQTISRSHLFAILRAVGEGGWATYTVMMAYSRDNVCSATQLQLMEALGIGKTALNARIRKLRENGLIEQREPGIYDLRVPTGFVVANSDVIKEDVPTEIRVLKDVTVRPDELTKAVDVMRYWREQYLATYGTDYTPSNWGREMGQINTLRKRYTPATLRAIIDVVMRLYSSKWQSQRFPRPTIGSMVSWLAAQAEPFAVANMAGGEQTELPLSGDTVDVDEMSERGWI